MVAARLGHKMYQFSPSTIHKIKIITMVILIYPPKKEEQALNLFFLFNDKALSCTSYKLYSQLCIKPFPKFYLPLPFFMLGFLPPGIVANNIVKPSSADLYLSFLYRNPFEMYYFFIVQPFILQCRLRTHGGAALQILPEYR